MQSVFHVSICDDSAAAKVITLKHGMLLKAAAKDVTSLGTAFRKEIEVLSEPNHASLLPHNQKTIISWPKILYIIFFNDHFACERRKRKSCRSYSLQKTSY